MSRPRVLCQVAGCDRPHRGLGMCGVHYQRYRKCGSMEIPVRPGRPRRPCSIAGCSRPLDAKGFCAMHYQRVAKSGEPGLAESSRGGHPAYCTIAGCERPYDRRGYCRAHADRLLAHGSATIADEVIEAQGGLCAICRRPARGRAHEARLHLDHSHRTGRRRGALCGPCNKGLGHFGDNPALLIAAAMYLAGQEEIGEVA